MRRGLILGAILVVAVPGVVEANLPYKSGSYKVDPCAITTNTSCSQDPNGTLRVTVRKRRFTVQRISFTDTCNNGVRSSRERFTFKATSSSRLAGRISPRGRFRGRFEEADGVVQVRGRVRGSRLTLAVTESGTFTMPGEPMFHCAGSMTFHARVS